MRDNPNYYAILTADVRYDQRLSSSEKLFYAEITALSNKHGYCYASNNYFADLYDVDKRTITRWVNKLVKTGHAVVEFEHEGKTIKKRKIYLTNKCAKGGQSVSWGMDKNVEGGMDKNVMGVSTKMSERIIQDSNTTSMNIHNHAFAQFWELYDKKVDRKRALQRWKRLRKSDIDLIMEFIPIYKKSVSDKQYMKNPDTFLNSRIWEDDWDEYKPKNHERSTAKYDGNVGRTQYAYDRYKELFGE